MGRCLSKDVVNINRAHIHDLELGRFFIARSV